MRTSNPVFQVLTTAGNQALLAAGARADTLANGQLGIFNYHTGLSVDGSVLGDCQDLIIMVGINRTSGGTATAEDIQKSAGQMIQVRNVKTNTVKAYTDEIAKVIELTGFAVKCETDYALKLDFKNVKSYLINGYNQFAKTFNAFSGCCIDDGTCDDCPQAGDGIALILDFITQINADTDALVTAAAFGWKIIGTINTAPTADGNTVVTVGTTTYTVAVLDADTTAQAAAKIVAAINTQTDSPYRATLSGSTISIYVVTTAATNTATIAVSGSGVTINAVTAATKTVITDLAGFKVAYGTSMAPALRITGNILTRPYANNDINVKYYKTGLNFDLFLTEGLGLCNGTITTITDPAYPEGKGYDLKHEEYEAGGWNGKPGVYRQSAITGLAKDGFEYFISPTANYTVCSLEYDIASIGGAESYQSDVRTVIAIPCADSTTLQGLYTVLDLIFAGKFGAMTNDVAGIDCTNAATNTLTPSTDGIEVLAY